MSRELLGRAVRFDESRRERLLPPVRRKPTRAEGGLEVRVLLAHHAGSWRLTRRSSALMVRSAEAPELSAHRSLASGGDFFGRALHGGDHCSTCNTIVRTAGPGASATTARGHEMAREAAAPVPDSPFIDRAREMARGEERVGTVVTSLLERFRGDSRV